MGKKFKDWSIEQGFLLPPSVEDFVPKGHLSHFVRELVREELDISKILSQYEEERGSPPYNPYMMVAVLLYSYMQGVYSSRKIAKSCEERLDFMAVSAMNKPDFRTVARFRKQHLSALGELFVQVLQLCRAANLIKLGHVALDGTKVKGNASKKKGMSYKKLKKEERELKEEVSNWLERAEDLDSEEDELYGEDRRGDELPEWVQDKAERLKRIKQARETLEKKDKEEREERERAEKEGEKPRDRQKRREQPTDSRRQNFTDEDSELLKTRNGFVQGYNAQIAVDVDSYVIVSSDVCNAKNDLDQLIPTLNQIEKNFGEQAKELSADTGYCTEANLRELSRRGVRGYVALGAGPPGKSARTIPPDTFTYQMSQRIKKGGKRSRYRLRGLSVEPVFGVIKSARGFQQFLLRGLNSVRNEWLLACTAHNLHKLAAARS